jgi:hypothetical protein
MTSEGSSQPPARPARINTPGGMFIRDLAPGTKLKLTNGAIVEVVMNANDGGWLLGRYLEHPDDPDLVGEEDWVYFGDVNSEVV